MTVLVQNKLGGSYSRHDLARLWGYTSFHALARGVVTPRGDNKIVLFVTADKQRSAEQYQDELMEDRLHWEGPTDHFAEDRMLSAKTSGDEIHLFFRERHHSDFVYCGQLEVLKCERRTSRPSQFVFRLIEYRANLCLRPV